jgi:hypothetical protein
MEVIMEYTDEMIQREKRLRKMQKQDIQDKIVIQGVEYRFHRDMLFANKASILLPETFVDLPSTQAREKYPMEQRPEVIKTSLDTRVNIAFSLFPQLIKPEQIKEATKQFQSIVKKCIRLTLGNGEGGMIHNHAA